jgi:hypothetical protein
MLLLNALIIGLLASAGAVLVIGLLGFLPRRLSCPRCRTRTDAIQNSVASHVQWVQRRWCSECGWTGWSRGPTQGRQLPPRLPVQEDTTRRMPAEETVRPDPYRLRRTSPANSPVNSPSRTAKRPFTIT